MALRLLSTFGSALSAFNTASIVCHLPIRRFRIARIFLGFGSYGGMSVAFIWSADKRVVGKAGVVKFVNENSENVRPNLFL